MQGDRNTEPRRGGKGEREEAVVDDTRRSEGWWTKATQGAGTCGLSASGLEAILEEMGIEEICVERAGATPWERKTDMARRPHNASPRPKRPKMDGFRPSTQGTLTVAANMVYGVSSVCSIEGNEPRGKDPRASEGETRESEMGKKEGGSMAEVSWLSGGSVDEGVGGSWAWQHGSRLEIQGKVWRSSNELESEVGNSDGEGNGLVTAGLSWTWGWADTAEDSEELSLQEDLAIYEEITYTKLDSGLKIYIGRDISRHITTLCFDDGKRRDESASRKHHWSKPHNLEGDKKRDIWR
ncbi:hypothetical protein EDB86DRAFT_2828144 [Lactarius hatsudake]|nr:hypothetical protein EDB86DRAFT_2828144 [Lactarius hatsudake]